MFRKIWKGEEKEREREEKNNWLVLVLYNSINVVFNCMKIFLESKIVHYVAKTKILVSSY